jgi:hypothetical protein
MRIPISTSKFNWLLLEVQNDLSKYLSSEHHVNPLTNAHGVRG